MLRIIENGVFSTTDASTGRFTNSLALLMVMGRVPAVTLPRMPTMANGIITNRATACEI